MLRFIIASFIVLTQSLLIAQTGTIRGKVIEAASGLEMIAATVKVQGTALAAGTNLDGSYTISNVPAGTYTITCSFISYREGSAQVVVKADEVTIQDFALGEDLVSVGAAIIEVKQSKRSAGALDAMKKKSATMMDGIGAAQIRQNSESNVAGAAKRVTGVSVEGGKYIYVRGLSDRYSKTVLNGAEIPGLDPNRNSVQLDIFPTALIDNMTISKTFSPDLPASFTGGLVNISTRDFPDSLEQSFSASLGFNTNATFNDQFLTYEGGKLDALGFDDGTRALPEEVANSEIENATTGDKELLSQQTRSFSNTWDNSRKSPFLNQSYSYSIGNQIDLKRENMVFGFVAAATYRRTFTGYDSGVQGRYSLTSADNTELNIEKRMQDNRGDENTLWGLLLNTSLRINRANNIGLTLLRNQNAINSSRYLVGKVDNDLDWTKEERSLRFQERQMTTAQLKGEHMLNYNKGTKLSWIASTVLSGQETPDLRVFQNHFERNDAGEAVNYGVNISEYLAPSRFFREMKERNLDLKLNYELPFKFGKDSLDAKFKTGVSYVTKYREFTERQFVFESQALTYTGDLNTYYQDENYDATSNSFLFVQDRSDLRNNYDASETVSAVYAMSDMKVTKNLRAIFGARVEQAEIIATSSKFFQVAEELQPQYRGELNNLDILPAINLSYAVSDSSNLRMAYTQTLARPNFREISPFASFDFEFQLVKIGEPDLQRTLVHNLDLRYEIFPRFGEILSASAYYKRFINPIEVVTNPEATNTELTWRNQDLAQLFGIELEARKKLDFISPSLKDFTLGVNLSYIQSETSVDPRELLKIRGTDPEHKDTRQMFGQSPYLINAYLNFAPDSSSWDVFMSYNVNGPKLVVVTDGGTPDVYDSPMHRLDLAISKEVKKNFSVKARVANILDAETRWVQEYEGTDYIFQAFRQGRTVTLSANLRF